MKQTASDELRINAVTLSATPDDRNMNQSWYRHLTDMLKVGHRSMLNNGRSSIKRVQIYEIEMKSRFHTLADAKSTITHLQMDTTVRKDVID